MGDKNKLDLGIRKTTNPKVLKAQAELTRAIEMLPHMLEVEKIMAKVKKERYDQLIKAGFEKTDALYIVAHQK